MTPSGIESATFRIVEPQPTTPPAAFPSILTGREKLWRISNLSRWVWQSSISSVGREESLVKRLRIDHSRSTHGQLLRGKRASVCTPCRRLLILPYIPSCLHPMTRNSTPSILTVLSEIFGYSYRNLSNVPAFVNSTEFVNFFYFTH
jgi:hypothetical protein